MQYIEEINGFTVVVNAIELVNGVIQITDAWIKQNE